LLLTQTSEYGNAILRLEAFGLDPYHVRTRPQLRETEAARII
jgi:hypothetical protein